MSRDFFKKVLKARTYTTRNYEYHTIFENGLIKIIRFPVSGSLIRRDKNGHIIAYVNSENPDIVAVYAM